MVFTEIDRHTMKILCTLVKLSKDTDADLEEVIEVGKHLGVPKDDTRELFDEIEEFDTLSLTSNEEKKRFVKYCFEYMDHDSNPSKSEYRLYSQVVSYLGIQNESKN